jgi:predicted alpha/beta-fold hydrolase
LKYVAPWWLPGGNAQTIWPAIGARRRFGPPPAWRRERWTAPDGDFVDLDFLLAPAAPGRPLLVLFHGLEGSSRSHYAQAFADFARERGLAYVVPHFRGCSGELNQAPRAYHSGDYEEIGWILARLRSQHDGPLLAVAFRSAAMRCCAGPAKRGRRRAASPRPWPPCAPRWTWPPVRARSGVASTGGSTPRCSCAA